MAVRSRGHGLDTVQFPELTTDQCVKCNICTVACPVVGASEDFLGPKAVGPQTQRFRHPRLPFPDLSVSLCSGCGTCTRVCPHGVAIAEMNIQAKARLVEEQGAPFRDKLIARPQLIGRIARPFTPIVNRMFESEVVRKVLELMLGIHAHAPLPPIARKTFRAMSGERSSSRVPDPVDDSSSVAYFHGCSVNHYEPQLGMLTLRVLEELGCQVILPPQDCCGLPLQSNGLFKAARRYAARNLSWLRPFVSAGIPILGTSTSCTLQLKHEYRAVLGLDGGPYEELAVAVRDIFEWMIEQKWDVITKLELDSVPLRVIYHAPCQLRSHWMGTPALQILRLISELEIHQSTTECCGVAGTYGVKLEKYQIAYDVGRSLLEEIDALEPDWVITDSETCRWWLEANTGIRAVHPIEVLAKSMGISAAPER